MQRLPGLRGQSIELHHEAHEGHEVRIEIEVLFVIFMSSFEKYLDGILLLTHKLESVIPVKTGIQANPPVNEPGFPRARE